MGGASVQIAFEVQQQQSEQERPTADFTGETSLIRLELGQRHYRLFVTTFLGILENKKKILLNI
jgi:Golgi nucleoside diphosphatase